MILRRDLFDKVFNFLSEGFEEGDILFLGEACDDKDLAHDIEDGKLLLDIWSGHFEFLLENFGDLVFIAFVIDDAILSDSLYHFLFKFNLGDQIL